MSSMFNNAGFYANNWLVQMPNLSGVLENSESKFYGASDSVYAEPPSGKGFTLAN